MKVRSSLSNRLQRLPPYLFAEVDKKKKAALERGVDLIPLGVGDPDKPTPAHIVEAARKAAGNASYHKYPFGPGLKEFRASIAEFMRKRFGVQLDSSSEIYSLIGSKEGLAHLPLAVIDANDVVLVPDPGYPVYQGSTILANGEVYRMPLLEENGFLPDLEDIPSDVLEQARLLFIGYPNNPTSALATPAFFEKVVRFAKKHQILVAHDNAYSEMYYGQAPVSFLATPGAKDVGVEFHSLSKTYNMTGWRLGWICGNRDVVRQLATVKDNFDSGAFEVRQAAGIAVLTGPQVCVEEMRKLYKGRRDVFVPGLRKLGWNVNTPEATFYVWAHAPEGYTSMGAVGRMLDETGVLCTPGNGFGPSGEGFVRFALTVDTPRLEEALTRLSKINW